MTARRRMRSAAVALGLTALVAEALTGCGDDNNKKADYAAICVNPVTNERIDDSQCHDDREYDGHSGGFYWFYVPTGGGYVMPPVGNHYIINGGATYHVPASTGGRTTTIQRGGIPNTGGKVSTVSRGGFGGSGGKAGS